MISLIIIAISVIICIIGFVITITGPIFFDTNPVYCIFASISWFPILYYCYEAVMKVYYSEYNEKRVNR